MVSKDFNSSDVCNFRLMGTLLKKLTRVLTETLRQMWRVEILSVTNGVTNGDVQK